MNMSRRLIATTARRLEASANRPTSSAVVNGEDLPPVIQRHIQRHLNSSPSSSTIPNPFVAHKRSPRSPFSINGESSSGPSVRIPAAIPRRRQKQLAQFFHPDVLPPTTKSTAALQVRWEDPFLGERSITWSGKLSSEGRAGLYEGRKRTFKGHKHEVRKVQRDKDTADRLKGMEKRIEDWKKGKVDAKTSAKPALPF